MEDIQEHIQRLSETLSSLKKDLPGGLRQRRTDYAADCDVHSSDESQDTSLKLRAYDEPRRDRKLAVPRAEPRPARRKEIEARRYSGKESIEDYLLQFELTARRNQWTDEEKASALLCALDGSARQIIQELDDPATAEFEDVRTALLRRFGPTDLTEVHEQALQQLKLGKGQNIREFANEVQRLTKLAYPDIIGRTRDRMTVKHMIKGIPDRDVAFYIKEKDPVTVMEVCTLYERFNALNSDEPPRKTAVRMVKNPDTDTGSNSEQVTQQQLAAALAQAAETTNRQIQQLTDAVGRLSQLPPPTMQPTSTAPDAPPVNTTYTHQPSQNRYDARYSGRQHPPTPAHSADAPRKPCPRCGQQGHWARDCQMQPAQSNACFRCGKPGHRSRDCKSQLNFNGPMPAPDLRSTHHTQ